jgi:SAM-dependent methyltransferase
LLPVTLTSIYCLDTMRTMNRVSVASDLINAQGFRSVLDVGCRDAVLQRTLKPEIAYAGCDLFPGENVRYVGDILTLDIRERFDCVVALDILEHTDDPYAAFDKIAAVAERSLVVSLPNCYAVTLKWNFLFHDCINGKYDFPIKMPADRHKWLMNCEQIAAFFQAKATQHAMRLSTQYIPIQMRPMKQWLARAILPSDWMVISVVGVFGKH